MRKEHDFLGELSVPDEVYYGVQTIRAVENFKITGQRVDTDFIIAMAQVKKAAILANMSTGRLEKSIGEPLQQAAEEIIGGRFLDQFPGLFPDQFLVLCPDFCLDLCPGLVLDLSPPLSPPLPLSLSLNSFSARFHLHANHQQCRI